MTQHRVFVGGLNWGVDDAMLEDFFAQCGEVVQARVVIDRDSGHSRGFGFVTFASERGVARALELNGEVLDGQTIRIDHARSRR